MSTCLLWQTKWTRNHESKLIFKMENWGEKCVDCRFQQQKLKASATSMQLEWKIASLCFIWFWAKGNRVLRIWWWEAGDGITESGGKNRMCLRNCSVSRCCRCKGCWKSIRWSQFLKKQSSHRTDLLSFLLTALKEVRSRQIPSPWNSAKSFLSPETTSNLMATFSAAIKYAWKAPSWMSLSANSLGSRKKRRKDNGGNLAQYWLMLVCAFLLVPWWWGKMKHTLHWSETKKKVSGAWWEKSKWRAEPLALQEKRSFIGFSCEKSSGNKEHRFRWSSCHLIP